MKPISDSEMLNEILYKLMSIDSDLKKIRRALDTLVERNR